MKNYRYICVILLLFATASCDKDLKIEAPNLNISVESNTIKSGDTVKFIFHGSADYVTFYSGEEGHNYEFRTRTKVDEVYPSLQFTSFRQWGSQVNTLSLLVSSNYNGIANQENIYKADWIDITSRAILSTGADNTSSGSIDFSEFKNEKLIYIAFKYEGWNTASSQRTWTIKNFQLNSLTPEGKTLSVIPSISDAGWISADLKNETKKWNVTATQIQMAGGGANTPDNEDWVISKGINLSQVSPDVGIPIMDVTRSIKTYEHIYTEPGTYNAVFYFVNGNVNGQYDVVKKITIVVE